jgi:hypothetical protein
MPCTVGIGIELGDALEHHRRIDVGRIHVLQRAHAGLLAGGDLVAHIDGGGRVFADQDHGEAGRDALGDAGGGAFGELAAHFGGKGVAVDDSCSHEWTREV